MTDVLVGRDVELAGLSRIIHDIDHRGRAILVRGDPGVGKTSVARAALGMAEGLGLVVLESSGIEAESALPYAGLHYLLRPLLDDATRLVPVQHRAILTAFGLAEGPPPEVFLIALAALNLLTERAASRPLVAVVDDLQWLDPPTNEVLAFIARRVQNDPIIIIGTLREGHQVAFATSGPDEVHLRGLGDDDSREVLGRSAKDLNRRDLESILEQAQGNPLALTELPATWRSTDPSAVRSVQAVAPLSGRLEQAFAARVTELPPATRDALLVAAIDSEDKLAEILAAASILRGSLVDAEALEPAEAVGILRFDETRLEFRHPLVRSGILQNESVSRRQAGNAALGQVLDGQPYRRAWHRAQAVHGPDDAIADELHSTHFESVRRGAIMAAISALERSAQLTTDGNTRGRRLLLAAQHAFELGRADLVDRLIKAAEENDLSELDLDRVEYLREIFNDGKPGDSRRVLELAKIAQRSAEAEDTDLALHLLGNAALRCWWADTGAGPRARVVDVVEGLSVSQDDPRCIAAVAIAEPVLRGSQTVSRLASLRAEEVTDAEQLRLLGMAARAVGDEPKAADFFDRAEIKLRDQGRLGLLSHVLAVKAAVHVDLGDLRKAAECVEEGVQLAHDTRQPNWSAGVAGVEAMIWGLSGETDRALQRADEIESASTFRLINDALCCAQLGRGFAHLSAGRHGDAFAALTRVFDPADPHHHPREQLCGVMFLAEAAMHSGQQEEARKVVARLEEIAQVTSSPVLATQMLYARAVLADDGDAETLFLAGLRHDLSRWPWTRARIQLAYGYWLRRQRRVSEAREPLTAALSAFELVGAVAWIAQAKTELLASGVREDPPDARSAVDQLSPQELRIARLAADGLSNREIGQQLYLSPRTVGSHLYHVFPKLGIRTRAQLSARLQPD